MNKKIKKNNKFAEILQKYKYNLHSGDIVAGTIIHSEKKGLLINIGTKNSGYLPKEEIELVSKKNINNLLLINMTRDFFLITQNTYTKQYILSIRRLDYIRAWKRIKQFYLEDIIFNTQISYINKGGIITYLEGIQGFIPKSHLYIEQKKQTFNKKNYIKYKILDINENKNQLILSNKSANLTLLKHKFKIGEILYGKITIINSYGLFLNIYGIRALLHISEIGSKYIKSLNILFKNKKLIKVQIIHINIKQGKISVSTRNIKKIH
uniref:Ribosomal protein S1 n=1 Tax=Thaumatella adunca TaxID=2006976 RepID=A0A1Z1MN49_9FLOR|nr:ribosomal protein S1 [Thaumatella adunca]ARW67530.1 ribosomal protein S1 [Thaumatella adunca]